MVFARKVVCAEIAARHIDIGATQEMIGSLSTKTLQTKKINPNHPISMEKVMLKRLTREELLVLASEAKSTNDQELLDQITNELIWRNI